jgi:hypothetical protein
MEVNFMSLTGVSEFAALVLSNLKKNNFPNQSVAFQLDPLYESAHKKGVHFNKVRDLLNEQGIKSEIVGSKVVFSALNQDLDQLPDGSLEESMQDPNFMEKALNFLSQMDPSYLESLGDLVPNGDKEQIKEGLKKFLDLTPDQRKSVLEMAQKFAPKK